jgi:hypothetical protein
MARISSGRQCINSIKFNTTYCTLHGKHNPHGDIREPIVDKVGKLDKVVEEVSNLTSILRDRGNENEFIINGVIYTLVERTLIQKK